MTATRWLVAARLDERRGQPPETRWMSWIEIRTGHAQDADLSV